MCVIQSTEGLILSPLTMSFPAYSASSQPCGVECAFEGSNPVYLPLEQLDVHADVVDGEHQASFVLSAVLRGAHLVSATVTLTQTFWQYSPQPVSRAKYVFPVPARAAVCGFEMRTEDGRIITAISMEKETARREHEQAIQQGRLTGLVEHVQDDGQPCSFMPFLMFLTTHDTLVFTMSLGSLPQLQMITSKLTVRRFVCARLMFRG